MSVTDETRLLEMAVSAIRAVSETARQVPVEPEQLLVDDLGLDSLDMVAVFMNLQDEHGIELDLDDALSFRRVADLVRELDRHLQPRAA